MGELKTDLERAGFELIETHISWVFLGASEAFKVKRPVSFGFLDFATPEARREACEAEVELNRRLAPDVYLGVVPVTVDAAGTHAIGGDGATVDWAVRMRRLRVEDRADEKLRAGELGPTELDRLAALLARFHARAQCDEETSRHGEVEAIRRNVEENFAQTRDSIEAYMTREQAHEIEAWQLATLRDEQRFSARVAAGRVRDGHGDLRLEHVYFEPSGEISIIDCIEFNERFRYGDVCADAAFLSMDLAWQGRVDLAERFLARYARETGDYDLYSVVDFYESYRAFVRGKIASFLADDADASEPTRARAREEARRYFMLSLANERPPLMPPRVVAVGGMIASGKSRTAAAAGEILAAPVIGSDRTRKALKGLAPEDSLASDAWSGAYAPEVTAAVYEELWRLGKVVLGSGRPLVIDASFRTAELRAAARELADAFQVPFLFVECTAPREVMLRRLRARDEAVGHESDARAELLDAFEARYEPVPAPHGPDSLSIDTSQPAKENRERLAEALRA
jgi:aminoglycoside phosphotransferase family enzyme/predicted kinase